MELVPALGASDLRGGIATLFGVGKSKTFDFLGFTHCCGTSRKGKFMVLRLTSAKCLRGKLQALKIELRRRMHRPIKEPGQYPC